MRARIIAAFRLMTAAVGAPVIGAGLAAQPVPPPPRAVAPAQAPRAAPSVVLRTMQTGDTIRLIADSIIVIRAQLSSPKALLQRVSALREREERLAREWRSTPVANEPLRAQLFDALSQLTRQSFALMSMVEARCAAERGPRPAGYMGVNLTTELDPRSGAVRFTVVESVDPGSPAQRAGIEKGDTLLAIGGRDVRGRRPEPAPGLLEPGNRVALRVDRAGGARDVLVTVAPRPATIHDLCGEFERVLQPLRVAPPGHFIFESDARDAPRRVHVEGTVPRVPAASHEVRYFIFDPENVSVASSPYFAGAQFRRLDEWRAGLNLKPDVQGVLVNAVASGSPMAQAGLKEADVVTAVDGTTTSTPMAVVRALLLTEKPEASLQILRAGKKQTLTLRLPPH